MSEEKIMQQIEDDIRKGERAKLLYELLMETVGCTYENTPAEMFQKLRTIHDAYNAAVQKVQEMLRAKSVIDADIKGKKTRRNTLKVNNVSPSN